MRSLAMSNFEQLLEGKIKSVDSYIDQFCPEEEGEQAELFKAMNYSVKAGGKRIRPILMAETCKLFGEPEDEVVPVFMVAMEMIHTYSLVHDDLPAMDDDEYRRGQKTTHAMFGEDIGILTGDALLNYAFTLMAYATAMEEKPETVKAMLIISEKAGMNGMIGGQVVDVKNEGKPISEETLKFIHKNKTAALIEASMMAGALLGGAKDIDVTKVEKIAENIGMAFQIQDDILDVVGNEEKLGKPVLSDEKNEKTTYVTLYGVDECKKKVESLSNEAMDMLDELPGDKTFLKELITWLINRDK